MLGRDRDPERLTELVRVTDARLTTITGPGGAGKTRLAVAAAAGVTSEFPDGAYFVSLAAVDTEQVLWTSIAEVLDVPARERTPRRLTAQLASWSMLLVLDNFEQVQGADRVVARILKAAPGVAVIATSRRSLGLVAERQYPVTPLTLPDDGSLSAAEGSGAVQLFVHRARAVRPGFTLTDENVNDVAALVSPTGRPAARDRAVRHPPWSAQHQRSAGSHRPSPRHRLDQQRDS
ncbi:hypothetical protein GCM10009789_64230 [Kribbella sancticallisti]|uniref:NB-ARC domain-containing protein n=1 Tax=Kribbella sancticallisti TaxID=460087 RepID=A0ABP4Q8V8_9ACTN